MRNYLLLVMTDGRKECISKTIPSALSEVEGPIAHRFIYDDSGSDEYRHWLHTNFPTFDLIWKPTRQGFGGAINSAWDHILQYDFDYVFHLEDDFTFNRPVSLCEMAQVLEENPHLQQMALRRQAWSSEEIRAGGVVEMHPEAYEQKTHWMEHRLFFTTNPSLYRRSLVERGWPNVPRSEGIFTLQLLENPEAKFGYWGQKTDKPWVTHLGAQRKGTGY